MGGEKGRAVLGPVLGPGSPPRGRGKVTRLYALADLEGITPAWAGKSCVLGLCFELFKDHPRVGGEKAGRAPRVQQQPGSPPRGRGKARRFSKSFSSARITPAWAGKRESLSRCSSFTWDHPRVGGEKKAFRPATGRPLGSPPRGRGKVLVNGGAAMFAGITPAWAGKRLQHTVGNPTGQDHPRVGGEKISFFLTGCSPRGSPPRGRGKAEEADAELIELGITPAWAGKSLTIPKLTTRSWDHPRVGGEKPLTRSLARMIIGSPPRGRGKD